MNFSGKQRVLAVCMSLSAFALSQLAFGITTKKWQEDLFPDDTLTDILKGSVSTSILSNTPFAVKGYACIF